MKNNNLFIISLIVVMGSLTSIAALVWMQARDRSELLRSGLSRAYELQRDDADLQTQLSASISDIYTDTLNARVDEWINDTAALKSYVLENMGDVRFMVETANAIELAHTMRADTIEDFKTIRSIINNSFHWLRMQESKNLLNSDEGWVFHRLMDGFYTNDLAETMETFTPFGSPLVQQHMIILYDNVLEMNRINIQLAHSRADVYIEKLIDHLETDLADTETQRTRMMWSFVGGIIFTLFMIVLLYWKERVASRHIQRLANDLGQFVEAMNQSDIVTKTDPQGNITYANDAFCAISGYSREELIGRSHSIVRHPLYPASVFEELWKTISSGRIYKGIIKNRHKDGSAYTVDTTIVPLKDAEGEIIEYLAIRHDVSELVSARDHAIAAEKFKDAFLSNMSHELRTPLNGIIGFVHLLQGKLTDPVQQKYLKTIMESSDHLLGIINDILDLSKIKSEQFMLNTHPFALKSSFESLLERLEIQAQQKKINFVPEITLSSSATVEGDWLRVSQIVTNLLSNAFKFTPEGGTVRLGLMYVDSILTCRIQDTGIGMDERTMSRIFHAFEQADASITRKYGGTGLGLSITKELVQRMEGSIDVASRVGEGSVFTVKVKLPEIEHEQQMEPEETVESEHFCGHVLVAEDNEVNLMLITILLEEFGVEYTTAKDGLEAVERFQEKPFDLILMDENMPNLSGTEAMQQIRRMPGGNLPIVALTANVMNGDREHFLEAGMDGFVPKPIDVNKLKDVLREFLSH